MIFELLDRLCQIIENCSFLLTLQLSNCRVSCQKSFLEIISEVSWMIFCQKDIILLKTAKKQQHFFFELTWNCIGILYTIGIEPDALVAADKALFFNCELLESTQNDS